MRDAGRYEHDPEPTYIDTQNLANAVTLALKEFAKLYGSKGVAEQDYFRGAMTDQEVNLEADPTRHTLGRSAERSSS